MEDSKGEKSSNSSFEDLSNLKEEDLKPAATQEESDTTDVLGNGQLIKRVLVKGQRDTRPERTDICKINLEGRIQDTGAVVEKVDGETIQLGDYEVVQGEVRVSNFLVYHFKGFQVLICAFR